MVVMLIYKISACRPYKDFGRGFYLTDIPEQAERMAERVARIYGGEPVLNIYEIEDSFFNKRRTLYYRCNHVCCRPCAFVMNKIEIVALPKEQWKGAVVPLVTRSDSYYDFEIKQLDNDGCKIELIKRKAESEIIHTPEEYDFPDSLYQDHWEKAETFGVVGDSNELFGMD